MIFKKNIDKYTLLDWIIKVKEKVSIKVEKSSWVIVVLVAWWTASWKTSAVAKKIKDSFSDSQILSMDNYYRWPSFMKENPQYNFDQPEVLNLDLFFKHLKALKKWNDVMIPRFDFKNDPEMDAIKIKSSKIIIVEWLFALTDKISKLWDVKVFVDLGVHSQILRRLFRDVERTGDKANDILKYFLDVVSPMHKKYIEPTRKNSDIILVNDYIPELESKNAKIKDSKVRYKTQQKNIKEILGEIVYKLWGTYVGKTEQLDYFFYPSEWNYKKSWEIMKIRKFWFNRYFFTYFWPTDSKKWFEDRYSMKFFIDYNTLSTFKEMYPSNITEISKLRRTFYVSWVLICLDEFENGDTFILFKFDEKNWKSIISDVLQHLDIDARTWLKKSYIELID